MDGCLGNPATKNGSIFIRRSKGPSRRLRSVSLVATLIESLGWRNAFAFLSTGFWFVALPPMIFGIHKKHLSKRRNERAKIDDDSGEATATLFDLIRERRFRLILLVLSTIGQVDQAMIQHTNP